MALTISDLDCNRAGYGSLAVNVSPGDIVLVVLTGIPTTVIGSMTGAYTLIRPFGTPPGQFEIWGVEVTGSGTDTITIAGGASAQMESAYVISGAFGLPDVALITGIKDFTGFGGVGSTQHSTTVDNTGVPATEFVLMLFGALAHRTGGITMNASTDAPTHEVIVAEAADYGLWASAWVPGETPEPGFDVNATTTGNNATLEVLSVWLYQDAFPEPFFAQDVISTIATIDHDLLIGVEEDQHHAKAHAITDESHHPGGYVYKTGRHPQIEDADVLAAGVLAITDGMVGVTYDTQTGQTLLWNRLNGVWAAVEVTE